MRIFLTNHRTAWADTVKLVGDIKYPQKVHLFEDCFQRLKTGMIYVPHKVAEKVLDPVLCESLREDDCKTAFILASGNSHFAGISPRLYDNTLNYTYKFLPFSLTQVYAGRIAQSLGANDMITTDATACASSLKVMMDVFNLIKNYKFDRVVVLTVEDAVSNSVLEFFGEAKASLSHQEEQDGIQPSAFDDHNYGFRVAQGSALAIFESEDYVEKSGKMPIAELLGAYTASEACSNAIGQREDGQGFINSIVGTLEVSGVSADDIEVIKTHGTGTKSNNQAEKTAIESLFTNFKATSLKPTIGHTMGVSGLLETCLLMDTLCDGYIPAIANRTTNDDKYLSHPHEFNGGLILSIASGMGNVYSSALFRRAF